MKELKVFELRWNNQGDKEWIAARTNIEALKVWSSITDCSLIELDDEDEIVEIPKEQWGEFTVTNTDHDPDDPESTASETFTEVMARLTKPDIIAGTMYE